MVLHALCPCTVYFTYIGSKFKFIAQSNISSHQTHQTENAAAVCFCVFPAYSEIQTAGRERIIK